MQLDVVKLVTPNKINVPIGLKGSHPNMTYVDNQYIVYMKGVQTDPVTNTLVGGPWDWLYYDEDYIYQVLTELKWKDIRTGKKPNGLKGAPRLPRYIEYSPNQPPGSWGFDIDRPATDYIQYDVLSPTDEYGSPVSTTPDHATRYTNGKCHLEIQGPFPGIQDNSIPASANLWKLFYQRGGTGSPLVYVTELIICAEGYGRKSWQQWTSVKSLAGQIPTTPPDVASGTSTQMTQADLNALGVGSVPAPGQRVF